MSSLLEIRKRILAPLGLEQKQGCKDQAVVGGIEKLVRTIGKPLKEINHLFEGYSDLKNTDRCQRVEKAINIIKELIEQEEEKKKAALREKNKQGTQARQSTKNLNRLELNDLDENIASNKISLGVNAGVKLNSNGIRTYRQLLQHYPRRYEDRRALPSFAALGNNEIVTVSGTIVGRKAMRARSGMVIVRAFLEDSNAARLTAVWFNQAWLEKRLFPGQKIIISGKLKRKGRQPEVNVEHFEIDDDRESLSINRIVSIYSSTEGLSQAYIRRAVFRLLNSLNKIADYLPKSLLEKNNLISLDEAYRQIHFPDSEKDLQKAIRRLKFDEFLLLELRVLLNKDSSLEGKQFTKTSSLAKTFAKSLDFKLTKAQNKAIKEILSDMEQAKQMARLLQGDVGSGKTVVAATAIYVAVKNGYQAVLMAPTEILARQHFINLRKYLFPLGVNIELLTGTMKSAERREAKERLLSGQADLIIGTHALIQEGVEFNNLGLAVIDEEHRFGVEQRRKLLKTVPDVLVMSATPIPRSLALTLYGDLELSIIDELPPGRKKIETRLMNASRRSEVYRFAWSQIKQGRQVYLVTPLIEDSEALENIVSTTQMFKDLKEIMPKECRIQMLHGRMPADEKEEIMERFRQHKFDMLLSTTVIEVGVDIANASVMIIENAERFGLSQLHQLRGRVGRGQYESYCILVAGDRSKKTQQRLLVIEKHSDGFVIAEKDLQLRGPGEIRGTKQSGMADLILGDLSKDIDVIEKTRELAKKILESDPKLEANWAQRLKQELRRRSESIGFRQII